MRLLNIYTMDYDNVNFEALITEDKLDDYIDFFIKENKSKHNFEVLEIRKNEYYVNILGKFDSYTITSVQPPIVYPERNSWIGFSIQEINDSMINVFGE